MISFSAARAIVIDGEQSSFVHALTRMGFADVRRVASAEQARRLCRDMKVDACLARLPRDIPDELPAWTVEMEAPGRGAGVPSLLVAEVVTPHLSRQARKSGYLAVIPAGVTPRLLHRWVSALMQKPARRQITAAERTEIPLAEPNPLADSAWDGEKFKLQ